MRKLPLTLAGSLLAVALLLPAAPKAAAQALPPAMGTVTARSYAPLTPGSTIAVVTALDSDQYERLKTAIENSLRARGFRISNDSPLTLEFYATEVLGGRTVDRANGGRAVQSAVPGIERSRSAGLLTDLNQSLFGEKPGNGPGAVDPGTAQGAGRQVHLSMTLTDSKAARRIWQGSAAGEMRRPDSFAATQSLVPFLVDKVGTTVTDERFDVP